MTSRGSSSEARPGPRFVSRRNTITQLCASHEQTCRRRNPTRHQSALAPHQVYFWVDFALITKKPGSGGSGSHRIVPAVDLTGCLNRIQLLVTSPHCAGYRNYALKQHRKPRWCQARMEFRYHRKSKLRSVNSSYPYSRVRAASSSEIKHTLTHTHHSMPIGSALKTPS